MIEPAATFTLDEGEFALVIGQDGRQMSVRIEGVGEFGEAEDLPVPAVLIAALAERLLEDPDFHDEMLEWYEDHVHDGADGDESDEIEDDHKRGDGDMGTP